MLVKPRVHGPTGFLAFSCLLALVSWHPLPGSGSSPMQDNPSHESDLRCRNAARAKMLRAMYEDLRSRCPRKMNLQQRIEHDATRPHAESWEGVYLATKGRLVLSARFDFVAYSGHSIPTRPRFGRIRATPPQIELLRSVPTKVSDREPGQQEATRYRTAQWGKRQYLVAVDELMDFCNLINSGLEPRGDEWGYVFLREGHTKLPVAGRPDLPKEFQDCILRAPIWGAITSVGQWGTSGPFRGRPRGEEGIAVRVSAGRNQGIREGMSLWGQTGHFGHGLVFKVSENSCHVIGTMSCPGDEIPIGTKVCSRLPQSKDPTENSNQKQQKGSQGPLP